MRKWLTRLIIVAVVLVVVGIAVLWMGVNYAAKKGVEVGGTAALGVETKADSVAIGFLTSSVGIHGFQIGNPDGYNTDRLMALGHGKVACDITSLLGDEVVVHEIIIDQPELTIELKPGLPPKSNLGDLLKKLESDKQAPPEDAESQKKFRVDLIRITKAKVRFHLLAGKTADIVLPSIEMKDVKNADGTPLMLADIFGKVLASMGTSAFKGAKGVVPDDLLKGLGGSLAAADKLLGAGVGEITRQLEGLGDVGKAAGEAAGKATKGLGKAAGKALKGIFGGKKKD